MKFKRKKILGILLVCAMCVCMLVGCGDRVGKENSSSKKMSVITTIYAPYDFAKAIVKDNADLTMLIKPGAEVHTFEPTPQDILKMQNCDVFIYVGGENDEWVHSMLESINNKNMKVIKLLDCVNPVEEELSEGMQAEEEENEETSEGGDDKKEWDEHIWTSPKNAILISKAMEKVFSEVDSSNKDKYEANLNSYVEKLNGIDKQFEDIVANAKRKTVVFGDRFPLRYFVEEYGLTYFAAFPGCSADTEASAGTVAFLVNKVKDEQIPVVFKIELSNGKIADTIAEATGAKVLTFYSCHNVTKEDFEAGKTYIDFMKENVKTLKEALN